MLIKHYIIWYSFPTNIDLWRIKLKKVIAVVLSIIVLATGAVFVGIGMAGIAARREHIIDKFMEIAKTTVNKVAFKINDSTSIASKGKLVDESQLYYLLGSGITGEGFEFDTVYYPYYASLNDAEKAVYRQAYANAIVYETTFLLAGKATITETERAIEAMLYDHPGLFYVSSTYGYSYLITGTCIQVSLQFNMERDLIPAAKEAFDDVVENIMENARVFPTDYEREKYVHDTIIQLVDYDEEAVLSQSAFSALVYGRSVCAGYARAFQYVMCRLGIPTYYCTGFSKGSHAWNIVCLEDEYYHVDLTWDDTEPISHQYFNCTDLDIQDSHVRDEQSQILPQCFAEKYRSANHTRTGIY